MTLIQASAWNVGTCRLDVKGAIQVETPRESEYRCEAQGRTERSSDEAPVMGVERRTPGHPAFKSGQPRSGRSHWRKQSRSDLTVGRMMGAG